MNNLKIHYAGRQGGGSQTWKSEYGPPAAAAGGGGGGNRESD